MKKFERKPRSDESTGTRTGPRARAAQERNYGDPYAKAERPARPSRPGFERGAGDAPRRPSVITLDPDVARVFRNSEAVNEVLRMVMRLGRLAGGRPAFNRDRPPPPFGERRGPPPRGERPQERRGPAERRGPPRARTPRFEDE